MDGLAVSEKPINVEELAEVRNPYFSLILTLTIPPILFTPPPTHDTQISISVP